MNYSRDCKTDSPYVSVNSLLKPRRTPGLSLLPSSNASNFTISQPNDPVELEADRVADQVIDHENAFTPGNEINPAALQTKTETHTRTPDQLALGSRETEEYDQAGKIISQKEPKGLLQAKSMASATSGADPGLNPTPGIKIHRANTNSQIFLAPADPTSPDYSMSEYYQTSAELSLVANPGKYESTEITRLPEKTAVKLLNQGRDKPFNRTAEKFQWWQVVVCDPKPTVKEIRGQVGWVMKIYLTPAPAISETPARPSWTTPPKGIPEALNIRIAANPEIHPLTQGSKVSYGVTHAPVLRAMGSPSIYNLTGNWAIIDPSGKRFDKGNRYQIEVELDKAGRWRIEVPVKVNLSSESKAYKLVYEHDVTTLETLAKTELPNIETADFIRFRVGLEMEYLQQSHFAEQAQTTPTSVTPHITCENPNPATQNTDPDKVYHDYRVRPNKDNSKFRWYVLTNSWVAKMVSYAQARWGDVSLGDRPPDMIFYREGESEGLGLYVRSGYENTTSRAFRIFVSSSGIYIIVCEEWGPDGKLIGRAKYVQIVLRREQGQQFEGLKKYREQVDKFIEKIQPDKEIPIKAIYVNQETSKTMALNLYMGPDAQSPTKIKLLDLTPGVGRIEYGGDNFAAALSDFEAGNDYPKGIIRMEIPSYGKSPVQIETKGSSTWEQWSSGTGWAALGLAGLGIILALIPGGQVFAAACFIGSAALGAASASLDLYDRLKQAEIDTSGVAIDVLFLASSIISGATAFRALRMGAGAFATKAGRFLLWAGFATNTASGVLITEQGVAQIIAILEDTGTYKTRGEKIAAIVKILASLALQGGLMVLSTGDLRTLRGRLGGILGRDAVRGLSSDTVTLLSLLDDDALRAIKSAGELTDDRLNMIAKLIKVDPVMASRIIRMGHIPTKAVFGEIPYGSSDLSMLVIKFRQSNNIFSGRNVAVYEYIENGVTKTMVMASERGVGHAERQIAKELEAQGIKPSQVTRIYSELQPCGSLPGGYCAEFIAGKFPQAKVTYSFEYGDAASRARGVDALVKAVQKIFNK